MISAKKIIIADDHPLFRDALKQAVQSGFGDIEIITCGAFAALQRAIESHDDSDLILLDLQMPGAVGFSALRYLGIRCPHIPIAIVSAHEEASVVMKAIEHNTLWAKKIFSILEENKIITNKPTANFFLMNFDRTKINSELAFEKLAGKSLILRKMDQYKIPNSLRLTIGNKKANEYFIKTIGSILK